MTPEAEYPRYTTRLVTVPVVTQELPRRRSLPGRVGPWPIKRSHSEADRSAFVSGPAFGDPFEEAKEKPNLEEVLKKIDEECATIEKLVTGVDGGASIVDPTSMAVSLNENGQMLKTVDEARAELMLVLLIIAIIVTFAWPPMMTFLFANKDWGKIRLKAGAPSITTFASLLAVPTILVSMSIVVSFWTVYELKKRRNLLQQVHKLVCLAIGGFGFGMCITTWVLLWLLP